MTNEEASEELLEIHNLEKTLPTDGSLNLNKYVPEIIGTFNPKIKSPFWPAAIDLYRKHTEFIIKFLEPLFWLVHLKMYFPNKKDMIDEYNKKISKMWTNFLFPLETDIKIETPVRDIFLISFPYYSTQVIQKVYMLCTHNMMETLERSFRTKICGICVEVFTSMTPLETQLTKTLANFFESPPEVTFAEDKEIDNQTDLSDIKAEMREDTDILGDVRLPLEDLSTLTEMQRRKRPISKLWNTAGVSNIVATATGHRAVPFEHDANIVVQYPEGGEGDWTSRLPPLLPPLKAQPQPSAKSADYVRTEYTDPAATMKRNKEYNPMSDPRSLLHRSRRPDICDKVAQLKAELAKDVEARKAHQAKVEADLTDLRKRLLRSDKPTVDKFLSDLRALQAARKRNETPELAEEKGKAMLLPQAVSIARVSSARKTGEELEREIMKHKKESQEVAKQMMEQMRAAHDDCIQHSTNTYKAPRGIIVSTVDYKPTKLLVDDVVQDLLESRREQKRQEDELRRLQLAAKTRMAEAELAARDAERLKNEKMERKGTQESVSRQRLTSI